MHVLRQFIVEVHRRSLWQVLGIYLGGSYLGYEAVNELTAGLGLPAWVPGFAIALFVIGLPIVLATAFVQDGLPGQRGDSVLAGPSDETLLPGLNTPYDDDATSRSAAQRPAPGSTLFTWKKAVLGGITAFLLLGLTAGAYMGMRNAGIGPLGTLLAKGELDERQPILLAAFDMPGGDSALAATVTEAFRVDFEQTPTVRVTDNAYVRNALTRMGRPADTRLSFDLAREMAEREGIGAVLGGEIRGAGGSYLLTVRLVEVDGGSTLASFRETADDSTQILQTVDRLSKKMRDRIGESPRTIRANQPLEAVTTPSLQALRKYTQAVHAGEAIGDYPLAIVLLRDALAMDSTFAMAWRKLAVAYGNSDLSPAGQIHAATRAYELRDRLTERERQLAIGYYHTSVTRDVQAAIAAYRTILQTWPDDLIALNNISLRYMEVGRHQEAATTLERRIALDASTATPFINLITALTYLEQWDSVDIVAARARKEFPEVADVQISAAMPDLVREDYESVQRAIAAVRAGPQQSRGMADLVQASLHAATGAAADAERLMLEYGRAEETRGVESGNWRGILSVAFTELAMRRDPARAIQTVDRALREHPLDELPALDRPYMGIAILYARAGAGDRAKSMLAARQSAVPPELRSGDQRSTAEAQGWLQLLDQNTEAALESADELRYWCDLCRNLLRAAAWESAGRTDQAIAAYEDALGPRWGIEALFATTEAASVHERLAELYENVGDRDNAIRHASRFVELWRNADADLQPRVRAKQELINRLSRSDRGD